MEPDAALEVWNSTFRLAQEALTLKLITCTGQSRSKPVLVVPSCPIAKFGGVINSLQARKTQNLAALTADIHWQH
jgi:hypothetical protein